jgi:plasmid stabilization system protein ParE
MYSVKLTPRAERIILNTIDFYNSRRKGEGNKFYDEIIAYFSLLSVKPELFQNRYLNVRVVPMRKHPHLIFYKVEGKNVFILSVLHSSQDTKKWPFDIKN